MRESSLASLFPARTVSSGETAAFGARLSSFLRGGMIVGLEGDLGAGKTQLVRGICEGFGFPPEHVHSPTFTIVNQYVADPLTIYHFDAYRVERLEELYDLGYEDYFFSGALCLVEWADRISPLMPADALRLRLMHAGENERLIELA